MTLMLKMMNIEMIMIMLIMEKKMKNKKIII